MENKLKGIFGMARKPGIYFQRISFKQ